MLIRFLKSNGIPFILPGLLIFYLYQKRLIELKTALEWLKALSAFISEDESSTVGLLLEEDS